MKIFPLKFLSKKKDKEMDFIEKELKKGKVILPTDLRDYEDLEDFKLHTKEIDLIKNRLVEIEENAK